MPDWDRIFPDADHRWTIGIRTGDTSDFFAARDPTGAVLAERSDWLAAEPAKYAALAPEALPALRETIALALTIGTPLGDAAAQCEEPFEQLLGLGRAWEPDFIWMHPGDDGQFHVTGGVVCFPSHWALGDKVGLPMRQVHDPVPGLNDGIGRQIDLFLAKVSPGVPCFRENWSLTRDPELNHHTSLPRRRLTADISAADVWIRLEHQLLLKLPDCGSVLFGIRLEIVPATKLVADRAAAGRLARLIETMSPEALEYKQLTAARPALLQILRGATSLLPE